MSIVSPKTNPVIFHYVIFHNGHDRNANARILAAFCYGQQFCNVGVARGARRTGEIRQNFSVAGQITAGPTSKIKDARISDAECEHERDPIALQFHPSSIPRGNPSGETKASNSTVGENSVGNSSARERQRHNSTRFLSPASSKFKSSSTRKTIGDAIIRKCNAKNLARFAFLTPGELEVERILE